MPSSETTYQGATKPAPSRQSLTLAAPIAGWVTPLSEVPDPVFSDRLLGDGVAIDPTSGTLSAPCDGIIIALHRGCHAVTIQAANGAEILMHIGLDTVALGGIGFTLHVAQGDSVKRGAPLVSFDLDDLFGRVKSLLVPIILTNGERFALTGIETDREIEAGAPLFDITSLAPPAAQEASPVPGGEVRREVVARYPYGIHARPAAVIAQCAKQFSATLTLVANGRSAKAESAVGLLLLGVQANDLVAVIGRGSDAEAAVERLARLLEDGREDAGPAPSLSPGRTPTAESRRGEPRPPFAADQSARLMGVPASAGQAMGRAFRLTEERLEVSETGQGITIETEALVKALVRARADIEALIAANSEQGKILAAHLAFLDDPELFSTSQALIGHGKSAAFAWRTAIEQHVDALRRLDNPLLVERASDLLDVERRILLILLNKADEAPQLFDQAILVADDLLPSALSRLDAGRIAGICLGKGGVTSHVAIMAASMGIPALVAMGDDVLRIPHGTAMAIDTENTQAWVNPPSEEIQRLSRTLSQHRQRAEDYHRHAHEECRMADGTRIPVLSNLGTPADIMAALANGAEGCGLLRSEFLFLDRESPPSEDEQLAQYQAMATALDGRPLIIRTLDAGSDKELPYLPLPEGENPALGLRGIRFGEIYPELLRAQLRAIIRVQPVGQCSILLPMVATVADLRHARAMLDEEKRRLDCSADIPLGIMVEVPSAAMMADRLAAEADFFSVGTNDLTQYALAMDRGNPHFAGQLNAFHPAVLRLIERAAAGARVHNRWVGICGGLASHPLAAPLLIGLGVSELSAVPAAIPAVKALIRTLTRDDCHWAAEEALAQDSAEAVQKMLAQRWPEFA